MTDGKKPCANCGGHTVVERQARTTATAAGTYDLLVNWGVSEDAASRAVESGVRATAAADSQSVLAAALSASDERARVCEAAYLELEQEYEELERTYDTTVNAFEGASTQVDTKQLDPDSWEDEDTEVD